MTLQLSAFLLLCALLPLAAAESFLIPAPPALGAKSYLLMDAETGHVLVEQNAELRLPPASLTKIMTSYVLASYLENGVVQEEDMVSVSERAWAQNPELKDTARMFIEPARPVLLQALHRGIVVSSGNDASIAIAEYIAGSVEGFADLMNRHARRLGMMNTHFVNAHGLPAEEHYTAARDMAVLARALIRDYPEQYALYAEKEFTYSGISQKNRNRLLWDMPIADGIKTGHTEEAGYCLVASAKRGDMRFISVIMGASGDWARFRDSRRLLEYGFRHYETVPVYRAGEPVTQVRAWGSISKQVPLTVQRDVVLTLPRHGRDALEHQLEVSSDLEAPAPAGIPAGHLALRLQGREVWSGPLVTGAAISPAAWYIRLWDKLFLAFLNWRRNE